MRNNVTNDNRYHRYHFNDNCYHSCCSKIVITVVIKNNKIEIRHKVLAVFVYEFNIFTFLFHISSYNNISYNKIIISNAIFSMNKK